MPKHKLRLLNTIQREDQGEYRGTDGERRDSAQLEAGQGLLGHEQAGRAVQAGAGRGGDRALRGGAAHPQDQRHRERHRAGTPSVVVKKLKDKFKLILPETQQGDRSGW